MKLSARHWLQGLGIAAVLAAGGSVANAGQSVEGDPERGRTLYRTCQTCHGANGEGSTAMNAPRLAGQHPWYLARQLRMFREGVRGGAGDQYGALMAPMARQLPDEQAIADVVSYIETLQAGHHSSAE